MPPRGMVLTYPSLPKSDASLASVWPAVDVACPQPGTDLMGLCMQTCTIVHCSHTCLETLNSACLDAWVAESVDTLL
jgi:hypothetical protein